MELNSTLRIFGFAALGTFFVDVLTLIDDRRIKEFPERYKHSLFWVIRVFLAVLSGGIALTLDLRTPFQAFFVGTSAPLLLQKMVAQTVSLKEDTEVIAEERHPPRA